MEEQELKRSLFKDLLKKMYVKGETEKELSTIEIVQDLEAELREIMAFK